MSEDKLEVMVVDDSEKWRDFDKRFLEKRGYRVASSEGSYQAIEDLAIRLYKGKKLPDIFFCDMQDRDYAIAVMVIHDKSISVHPVMPANILNYLKSKKVKPQFVIANTSACSEEDKKVAELFGFPLLDKGDFDMKKSFFPDLSGKPKEGALRTYAESYQKACEKLEDSVGDARW